MEVGLSTINILTVSLGRQEEHFLLSSGVNPGAILPTFQNCSFTFNVNLNNSL